MVRFIGNLKQLNIFISTRNRLITRRVSVRFGMCVMCVRGVFFA